MRKQTILAALVGIIMMASATTAFAAADIGKARIHDINCTVINFAYNDAELLGTSTDAIKTSARIDSEVDASYKETLKKKNSTAITGYEYAAYGWVDIDKKHYTTAQLEYRSGGGTGEVYATAKSAKKAGKVEAQTNYVQQVGTAYVYYSY